MDVAEGSLHGKNIHSGTYLSIIDVYFARKNFEQFIEAGLPVEELVEKTKDFSFSAKEKTKFFFLKFLLRLVRTVVLLCVRV